MSKKSAKKIKRGQFLFWRVTARRRVLFISIGAGVATVVALYLINFGFAANCSVSSKLVNSCRPWIGATSNSYGVGDWKDHILYFEKRAGHKVDVPHSYHSPTQTSFSADELSFINRADTYLYVNWKPDTYWGPAGGSNASVNKRIDTMADSINKLGSKKIFLTIYHEPENDISKGGSKCSAAKGNKGSTAQYRAMWKNVRKRFDAKHVDNVVWVMNYMGWSGWDCAVKDLWPGNDLVDWITWDPYTGDKSNFVADMSRFYNFLSKSSDASHAFTSKSWGIGEMGYEGYDQEKAYRYYDDMYSAIKSNKFPRLKMYLFFDMNGAQFGGDAGWDSRTNYARNRKKDNTEQQHFNSLLKGVAAISSPTAPSTGGGSGNTGTQARSTIEVTTPTNNSTLSGTVNVQGITNTKEKIQIVTLRVDGRWVETDYSAPYGFKFNTKSYKNGKHTLILRALIKGQRYDSPPITFTVKN